MKERKQTKNHTKKQLNSKIKKKKTSKKTTYKLKPSFKTLILYHNRNCEKKIQTRDC